MTKRIIVTVLAACLVCGVVFAQQKKAKDFITEGQSHMKGGNYAEAVAAFDAALKLEPKNKDAPKLLKEAQEKRMQEAFEQAQKLHQEEKYEEAITLYNAAIRYAPPGTNTRNIQLRRNEAQEAVARIKLQAEQEEQKALAEQQKVLEEQQRLIAEQQREQQRQLEEQQRQLAEQQRQREEQERLAKAQAERERAEQTRQVVQRANDLLIGGKYSEAITRYEEAIAMEGLNRVETTETNRLIAEAKALQAEMDKFNRPLQDSDFEVAQSGNIITITKYKASTSKTITVNGNNHTVYFGIVNVNIPQRVFGQNLSIIGPEAFKNCGLQSVVIPDTVTEIGYGAFANNNLEKVTLGRGLKLLKGGVSQGTVEVSELGAFEGNKSLTEIAIPDTVTEIGARAFKDCGLKKITLGKLVQTIGESAFRNNQLLDAALLPSVRYIRRFAYHQNQIKNLLIPNSILEIYDEAFTNNPMESVVIPASLAQTTTINNLPCPRIGGYNAKYTASAPLTFPHTLILVTLPANVHDDNLATFEAGLREYYTVNKKAAGVYVKNGPVWNFRR